MKVLVLGGAGYIGSHTVYELLACQHDVCVIDNLVTGHREAVHPQARFYHGDIRDFDFVKGVLEREQVDVVIHFAAFSQVGESMRDPLKYYDNNLCGTKTLLEAMRAAGTCRIVFSSTAAVYGEPKQIPIQENDPTVPTNTYGETKLSMEKMFRWVDLAHGIHYGSLRYFNACGAHSSGKIGEAHSPETHLIPLTLQVAAGLRPALEVYGTDYDTPDGTCIRDYIHVSDLAKAHILAAEYLCAGGKSDVFNLGSGRGFSVREVIGAVEQVTGVQLPVVYAQRRAGDPARLVASNEKAKRVFGWQLQYAQLEDMIATAWRWHRDHPSGYEGA